MDSELPRGPVLAEENLIPMYIIEDKLKGNFKQINGFMAKSWEQG